MLLTGYAYFVPRPRIIADLLRPHPIELERPYRIVKTVILPVIDYENFITDMLVDRPFIEAFSPRCTAPGDCLLVRCRAASEGILVIPVDGRVVGSAAYYSLPR